MKNITPDVNPARMMIPSPGSIRFLNSPVPEKSEMTPFENVFAREADLTVIPATCKLI
jgi:hypothetical protein